MEFSKRIKLRLCFAVLFILLGILSITVYIFGSREHSVPITLGAAFIVTGALRAGAYLKLLGDPEALSARETEETDERSQSIIRRAKSLAFGLYTFGAAAAVIISELLGRSSLASVIALNICAIVFIYWLSYIIIARRS